MIELEKYRIKTPTEVRIEKHMIELFFGVKEVNDG